MITDTERSGFLAELAREAAREIAEVVAIWAVVLVLGAFGVAFFVWAVTGVMP